MANWAGFTHVIVLWIALATAKIQDWQPQQVHLAYGEFPDEMMVTWVTINATDISAVQYGTNDLESELTGNATIFIDRGPERRAIWTHRVLLIDLTPDTRYIYRVGSSYGLSEIFTFKTMKNGTDFSFRLAVYGDLGAENPQSLTRLQMETQNGMYDAVLHVGDFAYDMDTDNARVGDEFMRIIQPIAAYVPYMVCPGNHEYKQNFGNYKARFSMPGYEEWKSIWYSWDMGPVHFVSISTEVYYYVFYGFRHLIHQYEWLKKDLFEANLPQNRAKRPWIILYGHRPMYCSNINGGDCTKKIDLTRNGVPFKHWFAIEILLANFGVDLAIWAHEHSYERLWPIYDYEVLNGSLEEPYTNPKAPVHVTSGSAGCLEATDNFVEEKPYWSAFRASDYGYMRLEVFNGTHLHFEQVSDDKNGTVIDATWLIKDSHETYAHLITEEEKKYLEETPYSLNIVP